MVCGWCGERIVWMEGQGWVHGALGTAKFLRCATLDYEALPTEEFLDYSTFGASVG